MKSEGRNQQPGSTARGADEVDHTSVDRDPTVRTPRIDADLEALPDYATHYEGPRPLPPVSQHKTIDMVPVRLAPEIDPRLARTRRLLIGAAGRTRTLLWIVSGVAAVALVLASSLLPRLRGRGLTESSHKPQPGASASAHVTQAPNVRERASLEAPEGVSPITPSVAAAVPVAVPSAVISRPRRKSKEVWLE